MRGRRRSSAVPGLTVLGLTVLGLRVLGLAALGLTVLGLVVGHPAPALATDKMFTAAPWGWHVEYAPESTTSIHYCPPSRVKWVRNAAHDPSDTPAGEPHGYLDGYTAKGFPEPAINGRNILVVGSDTNNATEERIVISAEDCRDNSYVNNFDTTGHELFHGIQYAYLGRGDKFYAFNKAVTEGHAKTLEGKIFDVVQGSSIIGASTTFFTDLSMGTNANSREYLEDLTGKTIWSEDYETTLWWTFLSKEYGLDQTLPSFGIDFMRTFWQTAASLPGENGGITVLRQTLQNVGVGTPLPEIFRRFAVANEARNFTIATPIAPLGGSDTYVYPHETQTGMNLFGNIPMNPISIAAGAFSSTGTANWYAARYYRVDLSDVDVVCQDGVVGFRAVNHEDDIASFTVMFIDKSGNIRHMMSSGVAGHTGDEYVATIAQTGGEMSQVVAVATGLFSTDTDTLQPKSNYDYTFACGAASLDITSPDLAAQPDFPVYAGLPDAPERILLRVRVTGPPALSNTSVLGLSKDQFSVWIGDEADPKIPGNLAEVLSGHESKGEYILIVQPPDKTGDPRGSFYDLVVKLGDETVSFSSAFDTEPLSIIYDIQQIDMQLVIDNSGSMLDDGKMDAAKSVAKAYVDWAQSDDQIGITKFDDTASLVVALDVMTSEAKRGLFKAFIDLIEPGGATSIGEGLATGDGDLVANGRPAPAEPWILLLSDGYENVARWVDDVMPFASRTRVHAIALGAESDQNLLQWIAAQPEGAEEVGRYEYIPDPEEAGGGAGAGPGLAPPAPATASASSGSLARNLADAYRTMFEASHNYERLWEAAGTGPLQHSLTVAEDNITEMVLSLYWEGSAMTLSLEDPLGNPVSAATPGARVVADGQHAVVQLDTLTPGTWTIDIGGSGDYHAALSAKVREGVQVELLFGQFHQDAYAYSLQGLYLPGIPMPIIAMLTDDLGPIGGATVTAEVLNPDGTTKAIQLYDDGAHYDGVQGDGVYANHYRLTHTGATTGYQQDPPLGGVGPGSYKVSVEASGTNNKAQTFERVSKGAFHLLDHPELFADQEPDGMPDRWEDRFSCVDSTVVDATDDPDGDGLVNRDELFNGTNPCNADTDFGGEPDGSEVAADRDPLEPSDDFIGRLEDLEVVTHIHHTKTADEWLIPNGLTLRFGLDPSMVEIDVYRRLQGQTPWTLLTTLDTAATAGIYQDLGLTTGMTYEYHGVPVGLSNVRGMPSHVIAGTARLDPVPPEGSIVIDQGLAKVPDANHQLALTYSGDAVEMQISEDQNFAAAVWVPVAATTAYVSTPGPGGVVDIHVQYRDAAGNVSVPDSDSVLVDASGSYGALVASVSLSPPNLHGGLAGVLFDVPNVVTAYTSPTGGVSIADLPVGSYDVHVERMGYQTVLPVPATISDGATTNLGQIQLYAVDSDNDGLWDLDEFDLGTDPNNPDTDGDGIQDGTELGITTGVADPDGGGPLVGTDANLFVPDADPTTTTSPLLADTDGDGLLDGDEDSNHNGQLDPGETDPLVPNGPALLPTLTAWGTAALAAALALAARRLQRRKRH